ncbi:MAG: flagellar biosynthesis regulator FlaF [Alphaproteobacteria bacterium]|nr:flagellar biosynthesis regulator FlaF [Alphaproteobacteria bacterium]
MSSNNPHTKAATAYGTTASATSTRALEGQVLLKAALKLEDLAKRLRAGETVSRGEIGETLDYNQKLWQLFVDTMKDPKHLLPPEIKSNVMSLALFIFKRSHEILINTAPEKFQVLVSINRNIAAGLMKKQPSLQSAPFVPKPGAEKIVTDSLA